MTTFKSFGDYSAAMKTRDIIERIAKNVVERERPRFRYAQVVSFDRDNSTCNVTFTGQDSVVKVSMGTIQPAEAGQTVRIAGAGGDYYIDDVIGNVILPNSGGGSVTPGDYYTKAESDSLFVKEVDLLSTLQEPIVIAHRGGLLVHPEHSMEGYLDAINSGFIPELDIQYLIDGTPVVCHDSTTNRTMTGVTGTITSLTLEQWKSAKINPPIVGGKTARALTLEEVLDQIGGRTVLAIEIKGAGTAGLDLCCQMILERGLRRSVLMQSFSRTNVDLIQAYGLDCVYLMMSLPAETPADMYDAGIRWVGVPDTMSATDMNSLAAAGLKVLPWGVDSRSDVAALPSSVSGYFSNDPWDSADQLQADAAARWTRGEAWPAGRVYGHNGGDVEDLRSKIRIESNSLYVYNDGTSGPTDLHVDISHMTGGQVDRNVVLTARFTFLRRSLAQTANVGFTLFRNDTNPYANFTDSVNPGQNGYTFCIRRNGELAGWQYTNGAAAVALRAVITGTEVAPVGGMGTATLRLEVTPTDFNMYHVESQRLYQVSHSLAGPFTPMLRIFRTEVLMSDVSISYYA
jgi:glycerophosphoryl diester phosphodiesterase